MSYRPAHDLAARAPGEGSKVRGIVIKVKRDRRRRLKTPAGCQRGLIFRTPWEFWHAHNDAVSVWTLGVPDLISS